MADVEAAARRKAHKEAGGVLSPVAIYVVRRIDEIFAIERDTCGACLPTGAWPNDSAWCDRSWTSCGRP
jgi:hypothetical protein